MLDASRVAVYIYFEPVVTVLLSVTILREQLTWQAALGALAIATSIVLVNRIKRSRLAHSVEIANAPTGENS